MGQVKVIGVSSAIKKEKNDLNIYLDIKDTPEYKQLLNEKHTILKVNNQGFIIKYKTKGFICIDKEDDLPTDLTGGFYKLVNGKVIIDEKQKEKVLKNKII